MTTLDAPKNSKRGFFAIYKPGQGKYVRWGTVAVLSILNLTGAYWIAHNSWTFGASEIQVQATAAVIWVAIWLLATFMFVNAPKMAEFMIMTESEMRKVTWPTRREVITSTKVVILMTLLLAFMLWFVDIGFLTLFTKLGIL